MQLDQQVVLTRAKRQTQRVAITWQRFSVQGGRCNAALSAVRDYLDRVTGIAQHNAGLKARPMRRKTRVDDQYGSFSANPKDAFDPGSVHPACGAGVPRPPTASGMGFHRIHVCCYHVGLYPIPVHFGGGARMIDGVHQCEQCMRFGAGLQIAGS